MYSSCFNISVYAIEASHIAEQAKLVVNENNLADKITVIHGKVEVSFRVLIIVAQCTISCIVEFNYLCDC